MEGSIGNGGDQASTSKQVRANGTGARGAFVPGERREDTATVEEEEKEGEEQRVGMK